MKPAVAVTCGVSALSALVLASPSSAQGLPEGVTCETVAYGGWENCLRLSNGELELIATIDVGPRIIRLGLVGGQNMFAQIADHMGQTGGDEWRLYGGHRLWHAPEIQPRTYFPDNAPVDWAIEGGALRLTPPPETTCGMQKEIIISMEAEANRVRLTHRITNVGQWPVTLAPWSLSVMAPGGRAVIPQEPYKPHTEALLPARPIVLWYYTNMADARWTWSEKYIQLQQDPEAAAPQKLGARIGNGWAAYVLGSDVFIKRFGLRADTEYPDYGCNAEFFTNEDMLEVESLGPLTLLEPLATVEHEEVWSLNGGVDVGTSDAEIDEAVLPLVDWPRH